MITIYSELGGSLPSDFLIRNFFKNFSEPNLLFQPFGMIVTLMLSHHCHHRHNRHNVVASGPLCPFTITFIILRASSESSSYRPNIIIHYYGK
jgi:hypothetical protein